MKLREKAGGLKSGKIGLLSLRRWASLGVAVLVFIAAMFQTPRFRGYAENEAGKIGGSETSGLSDLGSEGSDLSNSGSGDSGSGNLGSDGSEADDSGENLDEEGKKEEGEKTENDKKEDEDKKEEDDKNGENQSGEDEDKKEEGDKNDEKGKEDEDKKDEDSKDEEGENKGDENKKDEEESGENDGSNNGSEVDGANDTTGAGGMTNEDGTASGGSEAGKPNETEEPNGTEKPADKEEGRPGNGNGNNGNGSAGGNTGNGGGESSGSLEGANDTAGPGNPFLVIMDAMFGNGEEQGQVSSMIEGIFGSIIGGVTVSEGEDTEPYDSFGAYGTSAVSEGEAGYTEGDSVIAEGAELEFGTAGSLVISTKSLEEKTNEKNMNIAIVVAVMAVAIWISILLGLYILRPRVDFRSWKEIPAKGVEKVLGGVTKTMKKVRKVRIKGAKIVKA